MSTIADGIAVKEPGEHTFDLCSVYVDGIVTVTEDEICAAILALMEQQKLIEEMHFRYPVSFLAGKYDRDRFYEMAKGLEEVREGGSRCMGCYELRLKESAEVAVAGEFDYFTTTLSISPMKNAQKLNEIGQRVGEEYGVQYLLSDFKKKNGYKRSIELSGIYGLYRQDYCGCEFSYKARQAEKCV